MGYVRFVFMNLADFLKMNLQHFKSNNIAILLKPASVPASLSGVLEKVKTYYVLALVDPDTKGNKPGLGTFVHAISLHILICAWVCRY